MTHTRIRGLGALVRLAGLIGVAGSAVACNDFLQAENPGAIEEPQLNDPQYVQLIANGAIDGLQFGHRYISWWNAIFTDELVNRAVFFEEGDIDRRDIVPENGTYSTFIYGPMQRARFLADDGAERLKIILGDTASRDNRLARLLAIGGYTYIYFGEALCGTPINRGAPKPPEEMFAEAVKRFDEAITVATAAKAAAPAGSAAIRTSDSLIALANLGAARAYLDANTKAKAIEYAQRVPNPFEFRLYYSENTTGQRSWFYDRVTISTSGTLANTPFQAMDTDPRVPRILTTGTRQNVPLSPTSFNSYSGLIPGADFTATGWTRLASYLEAQYIIAEAQGPVTSTLDFVNARRVVGKQAAVTLTGDALMTELRDQRSRDFYLDNHRLGDLRRYKKFYSIDLFPKGTYPGTTTAQVYNANVDCWPLPIAEINDNPNIPRG